MVRASTITLVLLLSACAPVTPTPGPGTYDRSAITRQELATRPNDNMYTLISALRPNWIITPMGASGVSRTPATAPTKVYVDGRELGDVDVLKTISADAVEHARFFTAAMAQNRFGMRAESPVIELISRGRAP